MRTDAGLVSREDQDHWNRELSWCQLYRHWRHRRLSLWQHIESITVTSELVQWRLKSSASRLFTQPFIQAQIKENFKVPRHCPLCGVTGELPAQMASNAENVSIWWRHRAPWWQSWHHKNSPCSLSSSVWSHDCKQLPYTLRGLDILDAIS